MIETFSTFLMPNYEEKNFLEYSNFKKTKLIFGQKKNAKSIDLFNQIVIKEFEILF